MRHSLDKRSVGPASYRTAAELLMERERRVTYGVVPHTLTSDPLPETSWQLIGDEFLLRGEGHHYFHYRNGDGVRIERGPNADISEESLWLNGSVHSAIASMNGLLPIHASAVAYDGAVYAFTAPPSGGKSTLVAALANHGFSMFCDDTLVLDISDPGGILCLPGHKRLKLCPDSFDLTGAGRQERVSQTVDKFYASPAAGDVDMALPLARLVFLEVGPEPDIVRISGAERFMRMRDDHNTAHLFAAARRPDRAEQFARTSRLARQIEMARFTRPRDPSRFHEGVDLVAKYVLVSRT
ncbi:MAG TPA: hypothetical protein VF067_04245 [Sphingomicrobium sp.]